MIFGECDACGAPNRVLHRTVAYGIETCACAACFGNPLADDADDLRDAIDEARVAGAGARLTRLAAALAEAIGEGA